MKNIILTLVFLFNLTISFGQDKQVSVGFSKNLSIGSKGPIIKEIQKCFGFSSTYQTGVFDQKTLKKLQDLYGVSEINGYTYGLIKEKCNSVYTTTSPTKSNINPDVQNLNNKEKVIPSSAFTPIILGLSQDKTTGCKFYTYNSENRYGTWSGTCKDGLFDGAGMLRLFEGDSLILISSCTYIGGYRNGESIDSFVNGTLYYGNYVNGLKEGKGKDVFSDGRYYDGNFKNGKYEGKGKYVYSNGNYYVGDFKNGMSEGKGKSVNTDGSSYEGDWKNNTIEGKGKYIFSDGGIYDGEFKNGTREGKGKHFYSDGGYYEGDWKNDTREGKGKKVSSDGGYYEGDWENNKMGKKGKGKFVFSDGGSYEGDFNNGKFEKGKFVFSNGDFYVGGFKDNELNGRGTYTYKNGLKDIGIWESNKLVTRDVSSTTKLPGRNQISKNTQPNQGQNIILGTKTCTYCSRKFNNKNGYIIGVEISCATSYPHASLTVEMSKKLGYDSKLINQMIWGYNNGSPYCSQKCVYESGKTFCAE